MTEFQTRIVNFLAQQPNRMASTWEIAQKAFPEKWKKASGRGALVGHIRAASRSIPNATYFAAETYPGCGTVALYK